MLKLGQSCYWRFKGDKEYRYGWPSEAGNGLVRMGRYNGDLWHGPLVSPLDIEVRS